jgi:hypothetical protein
VKRKPAALAGAGRRGIGRRELPLDIRLRRQRQVARICSLGARVVFELIDEIDRAHGLGEALWRRLERYADLDPDIIRLVGADRFRPLPPPRLVSIIVSEGRLR